MQQPRQQRRIVVGVLSLTMLVGAALTSNLAQADTGAGPYYATPAWDRTLTSAGRFMVLTNMASQAVLDRETGLVWERAPLTTTHTWGNARPVCVNRTTGNRKGWRLPSMPELASLIDPSVASPGPTLPPGHPFTNVQSVYYWSATSRSDDPTRAWEVDFSGGSADDAQLKTLLSHVWCVRGGMNAEVYRGFGDWNDWIIWGCRGREPPARGTGSASGRGTVPGRDSPRAVPVPRT